jgi:ATPase family associated with various cellular activities (AAA)
MAWFEFADAAIDRLCARIAIDRDDGDADVDPDHVEASFAEARAHFRESLMVPSPFADVVANAMLTVEEAEVLAVVVATELDSARRRMIATVQGEGGRPRLRLGTIGRLFEDGHIGVLALADDAGLRRSSLVELVDDGAWSDQLVAVHRSLMWAMLGDDGRDPDLPVDAELLVTDVGDGAAFVVVTGADRSRRRQAATVHTVGDRFIASSVPATDDGWAALVREATLCGAGVIVELEGVLPEIGRRRIEQATHLSWCLSAAIEPALAEMPSRPWVEVDAVASDPTDDEWRSVLGDDVPRTHHLTFDQLLRVQRALPATGGDLDAAVRRLGAGRLEQLARRIRPARAWDDIVLSADRLDLLRSVVDRYRYAESVYDEWGFSATPSRGVVALFSGPSGTGKTLAAEIVAGELGLDVFKIDLSAVVSKYIGETEKNLEQIFDAAGSGNVVLFFDEADALFGKRSEVHDARDRYANIEVSYLLQRLERYDGVAVLATNFEKNLDDAFLRRIHRRVEFVLPAEAERATIWNLNLPAGAPVDDIDTAWLAAKFELTGAAIRNAVVNAAFEAAATATPITMTTVVHGVAEEMRKMGRLINSEAFRPYELAGVGNGH